MDAKFQQLSQKIETLIRTTARAKGVEVGDNSAAYAQRTSKASEQPDVRFGGRNNNNNFGTDDNNRRRGEAQLWVNQLEQEEPNLTWGIFKEYCTLRFGPPVKSNPLGELINLKQTSSVEDYERNFQKMLARPSFVRIDQQVDMFTAGLVDLIPLDVELHNPSNLVQAMSLARTFEKKIQISSSTQKGYGSTSNISARAATTPVTPSVKVGASNPFVKKLTSAEMAA
ncbi:hypothetical protein KY289_026856 [Solanum tuberosum]|nr:hypothetical protein KY289_026856 [Solanum tuberosum]